MRHWIRFAHTPRARRSWMKYGASTQIHTINGPQDAKSNGGGRSLNFGLVLVIAVSAAVGMSMWRAFNGL
ncbi:MAG: hypothetical protein AAB365_01185 [Patescibacteria group bacterium]